MTPDERVRLVEKGRITGAQFARALERGGPIYIADPDAIAAYSNLYTDLADALEACATLTPEQGSEAGITPDTQIFYDLGHEPGEYYALPDGVTVHFREGAHGYVAVCQDSAARGGLEVRGSRRLILRPRADNLLNVRDDR